MPWFWQIGGIFLVRQGFLPSHITVLLHLAGMEDHSLHVSSKFPQEAVL